MSCIVPWCREKKHKNSDVSFFNLPKSISRRNKWLAYACIKDPPVGRSVYFCSKHFDEKWILTTAIGKVLHFNAIPHTPLPLEGKRTVNRNKRPLNAGRKKKVDVKDSSDKTYPQLAVVDSSNFDVVDGDDSDMLLESVKKQLCRICGRKRLTLIPIFEKCKKDGVPLAEKIEMHLPLKIQKDDRLPLNVCISCDAMVQSWYDLHVTCIAADAALRRMFQIPIDLYDEGVRNFNESDAIEEHSHVLSQKNDNKPSVNIQNTGLRREDVLGNIVNYQNCDETLEESALVREIKYFSDDSEHAEFRTHCSFCNEEFNAFQTLKDHKVQCRLRFAVCEFCGLSVQVRYLKTHISKVHEKSLLCEMCGDFFSWYKLKTHSNECVLGPTSYCEPCGRLFYSEDAFRSHIDGHEKGLIQSLEIEINANITSDDAMVYLCPVCEESFRDKLSVIEHLNSYKVTLCKTCNMEFRNERSFIAHVCKTTPKVWQCQFCFKAFKRKEALHIHENIHIGVNPFSCKICGEKFSSKRRLARHVFTHGPSSFPCPYCNKKFKSKATLRHHIQRHEGFSYECQTCKKLFQTYKELWSHRQNCVGNMIDSDINVKVAIVEDGEKPIKLVVQRISEEVTSKN